MCEPITATALLTTIGGGSAAAGTAAVASAGLSAASSISAINAQNRAHVANRANAMQAQNNEINDQGRQFVEQNRSLIQGGFDAILQGRAAEAEAYTSAIQNGVSGSSVRAMLRDRRQKVARNATRTQQERTSLEQQTGANFKHIGAKTQGRINSVSKTSWSLGDTAKALQPIARAQME